MKKFSFSFILMIFMFVLAACGGTETNPETNANGSGSEESKTITVEHELGTDTIPVNPEKVVVFDFSVLETMDVLGVEPVALPQANVPTHLSKYEDAKYENVGSLKEPDFEKIAEIAPDLIIISGRQAELYEEFKKIAPTVYIALDTTNYIDSFKTNTKLVGQIFGKEAEVEEELAKIDERIHEVHEKVTSLNKNSLIILANDGKISAYGAGSRFGLIHDVLGFTPVDTTIESSTHGQSISFEYIVEKDPDYLFVVDRTAVVGGETAAKEIVENELVENTKAYKEGHIVYLDPNYWYLAGGGLISVSGMIEEIENAIQ